jgi:hypothetical protein
VAASPFLSVGPIQVYSDAKPFQIIVGGEILPADKPEVIITTTNVQGATVRMLATPTTSLVPTSQSSSMQTSSKSVIFNAPTQTGPATVGPGSGGGNSVGKPIGISLGTLFGVIVIVIIGWRWRRKVQVIAYTTSGRLRSDGDTSTSVDAREKPEGVDGNPKESSITEVVGGRVTTAMYSHNLSMTPPSVTGTRVLEYPTAR